MSDPTAIFPFDITPLHDTALSHGCAFRIDEKEDGKTLQYSVRNLRISNGQEGIFLEGEYDIRAFLQLYRETADDLVKKLTHFSQY